MNKQFSIYIHIPWCIQKCPYCDFNSHAIKGELPEKDYMQALCHDFEQHLSRIEKRELISIFIGGGTPSLFHPSSLEQILSLIKKHCHYNQDLEITLEANPGTLEHYPFKDLLTIGVNRLSIGAQSFSDTQLQHLGRIHSQESIIQSVEEAKNAGFQRINLDIMYGLQAQSTKQALNDLHQALALQPEHLSWYQLTIEPHTAFYTKKPKLPQDEQLLEMFFQGQELLASEGYKPYEISAYTRNQACRHNLNYWRFGDYLGIGAGAHSKWTENTKIERFWNYKHPKDYLRQSIPQQGSRLLTAEDLEIEYLMNQLRLYEPMHRSDYERHTGCSWEHLRQTCDHHDIYGWIQLNDQSLSINPDGRVMIDEILTWFCD